MVSKEMAALFDQIDKQAQVERDHAAVPGDPVVRTRRTDSQPPPEVLDALQQMGYGNAEERELPDYPMSQQEWQQWDAAHGGQQPEQQEQTPAQQPQITEEAFAKLLDEAEQADGQQGAMDVVRRYGQQFGLVPEGTNPDMTAEGNMQRAMGGGFA